MRRRGGAAGGGPLSITALKSPASTSAVIDALRRRQVREVVYLHTDHFEPWRTVPGRDGGMDRAVDDVEGYLAITAKLDFARRASLFYKPNVNYLVAADRPLKRAHPEDLMGFAPRTADDLRIGRAMLSPIVSGSDHEVQVHIHHENFTYNDTARDPEAHAYLNTPRGRAFDSARLELGVRLSLDVLREDAGLELDRWFFIHGHWALNGSDPHECTIVREIELLHRNGCLGDFTQPAGRVHVDSRIDTPYLVDPVATAKGYDTPAAHPSAAAGAGALEAARRFFIWASQTTHDSCSIDTYSAFVQKRIKTPEATALTHARSAVVVDGVLYLKTHCHSLHPNYWQSGGRPMPHTDPGIRDELGALFGAADAVGAKITFSNASEVYDRIVSAPVPPPRDLVKECGLENGSPMERIGVTIDHATSGGVRKEPPPLPPRPRFLPEATLAQTGRKVSEPGGWDGDETVAWVVALRDGDPVAGEGQMVVEDPGPLISANLALPALMGAPDVTMINAVARRVALERSRNLGGDGSGVTGFYGPRSEEGALLQPSEVLCAAVVETRLVGVDGVWEIGCGLGVLTILLALRGRQATGVERNGVRLATARAIDEAVRIQSRGAGKAARWLRGIFPRAKRGERGLAHCVALVTNLLGSATPEEQQAFVGGLTAFGAVLIDVERFYERRTSRLAIDALVAMFTDRGFAAPRMAFDLGSDGRFMLFLNPRPLGRRGLTGLITRLGSRRAALSVAA